MDGKQMLKDMLDGLSKIFNYIIPIKLPGEIELAVWVWLVIIGVVSGLIAGVIVWIRRR